MPSEPLSPVGRTLVTTFGLGHLRPASGTWGSMPTVVIAACLLVCGARPCGDGLWPSVIYHGVRGAVPVVFAGACGRSGAGAGVSLGKRRPGSAAPDETAGQAIALFALPAAATATPGRALISLGLAFLAFRLCDIVKAWPARGWQRYPGGWGILIDDLVAGVQALVIVQVAVRAMWVW